MNYHLLRKDDAPIPLCRGFEDAWQPQVHSQNVFPFGEVTFQFLEWLAMSCRVKCMRLDYEAVSSAYVECKQVEQGHLDRLQS